MLKINNPIILASKSPRRHELLQLMSLSFEVKIKDVDESYPEGLKAEEIAVYIAKKKAKVFDAVSSQIVITADTIVSINGKILGKPTDKVEAKKMLMELSANQHEVYTGVCINYQGKLRSFVDKTEVYCRSITEDEIDFYIEHYQPFDKAGSYGIQDWFGMTIVEKIVGSYTNVMGLPTEKLYKALSVLK